MKLILLSFLFLFCSPLLRAETASTAPITLREVLDIARAQNPEILAARMNWESAKAKITSVKTWPDPEIGVEFWGFSRSGSNLDSSDEKWYDIAQTIPFPGKLKRRGKAAEHAARREEEVYRAAEREIVAKVKEAYYNLQYTVRAAQIIKENVEVLRRFAKIAESKYSTGKATQSDVLRAQTELSKMLNMRITSEQEQETAQAELNALLDRNPEDPISAKEEPTLGGFDDSFQGMEQIALANRPEVHAAAHHVSHMDAEIAAAKADYLPDFTLQYTFRERQGMTPDAVALVKFNLPFIWFWRQQSMVRATLAERSHAEAMLRSARTMARYEVKQFLVHVQSSRRLVELYKTTVLPQSEQSLRVSESAYQSGRIGFLELLDSERAYISSQLEYYQYLSQYGINLSHLEKAIGKDLEVSHE